MSEQATFTPMEGPEWLNPQIEDYWKQFSDINPETNLPNYLSAPYQGWADIRSSGSNLATMQAAIGPTMTEAVTGAANKANKYYDTMLSRLLTGETALPELGADSGYMTNYTDMVADPEDYSSFMADADYYTELAQQLLNPVEIGYGGQSMSFIPGSSADAYASILASIMDTQEAASKAYGGEKQEALKAYPDTLGKLLSARETELYNTIPEYVESQMTHDLEPYSAYEYYSLLPYQTQYDMAQQYPEGSWWNTGMNSYYNQWAPFELSRYYSTPSYELDTNTSALDMLSQVMGIAGVGNKLGVFDLLGDAAGSTWDWASSLFGDSGASTATDYSELADAFGQGLADAFSDTDWLSGLSW